MGRVHEIVVENFKSYEGRQLIGPFRKFTCVIGPNGAGKSNLMDAISFVLGVQARVLRSEKLRDLIYRREGEDPKKNQRTASVDLAYVDDAAGGEGETLVFSRAITKSGEARFFVCGQAVTQAEYLKRLEGINILSKVRNFLVFQGDVDATAQRQGKDLTAFFEQISGSEQLRPEYERLAAAKTKIEDNARFLFTKKRNAINEKKRVQQQKDEADEYRRLEGERCGLQREFYLFRLHGISQHLEEVVRNRAGARADLDAHRAAAEAERAGLEAADAERARAHLATAQAEKAESGARARLDKAKPEQVAVASRLEFVRQRIEDLQQCADKEVKDKGRLASQAQALREESARLEAEERALAERAGQKAVSFSAEQLQEFERAKRETEQLTAAHGDSTRRLESKAAAVCAERRQAELDLAEAAARKDHLTRRLAELAEADGAARELAARDRAGAERLGDRLGRLQEAAASVADEREQLQAERQQLLDTVQDVAAAERQVERERQLSQVCSALKEAVPGVHGRVVDLCRPSQKRLHVAVNVAVGKFLDAVVVDTSETARRCVRYLKERMQPPMTFLPLGDLRVDPVDPRLDELVKDERTARLALNCVTFGEGFARAFEFLLGDTVVADTMADGRRLAFQEARALGLKCKVVTLAGEAIAKNGNLSVSSEAAREGGTRFDVSELEAARARLEAVDRRLGELCAAEGGGGAERAALQDEVRRADARASDAASRLRWLQEQAAQKARELQAAEAVVAAAGSVAERLAGEEAQLRGEQRDIESRVGKAVAGRFAKLSRAMGVDDVQRVEREWRREQEAVQERADVVARRLRNAKAELAMLEATLREQATRGAEELLPQLHAEHQELLQKERSTAQAVESLRGEVEEAHARQQQLWDAEREKDRALSRLRQEAKERRQQQAAAEKRLGDIDAEEKALCSSRADVLRQSVLEGVEVPVLGGSAGALQDLVEASQPVSAPAGAGAGPGEGASAIAVDFASLPQEKRAASCGPAARMLEEEYRSELDRLAVELKRLSPNLKATEQMRGVAEHVQAASHEADAARKEIEDVDAKFEEVRKQRKERFMECFQKVSGEISEVYRRLTANTAGLRADGGSAYLDLEDMEDPFNGGVKFTAMPPAKRFRDMHLLSGGEKTLAAMALLFAVHAYSKPPFMVLDEVDAALDANNVKALATYVEQSDCQTIVISLKDRFFVKGEALVGVWKNKPKETSAVLSLDLSRYLPPQAC